jgi:hypothetical protein
MVKKRNIKNKKNKNTRQQAAKVVVREVSKPMSIGASIGDGLQKMAVSAFKRITGLGDYKLSPNIKNLGANALVNRYPDQPPTFGMFNSYFDVEHCEYIGDVAGTTAFTINSYVVNPSDPDAFPWLSTLATSFETYQMLGCIFRFESTSGNATGSNTALGNVMAAPLYDFYDALPTTKQAFLQYEGIVDAKPSESFLVGLECDPNRLPIARLYIGVPPSGADAKFYNMANFAIATQGQQGTNTVGELWVHYKIRFFVAKIPGILPGLSAPITYFTSIGPTNTLPLNLASPSNTPAPPGIRFSVSSTYTSLSFEGVGNALYLLYCNWTGSSTACGGVPSFTFTNCALSTYPNAVANILSQGWNTTTTVVHFQIPIMTSTATGGTQTCTVGVANSVLPVSSNLAGYLLRVY